MNITVQFVYICGEQRIYPACAISMAFASMLKQQTLTDRDIDHIKQIGFTVDVMPNPVTNL